MSLFGSGVSAAVALRARILDRIGAEEAWTKTSEELGLVAWMSGPVATFFRVSHGADDTPDLGILRIVTPVAAVGDIEAALSQCDRLNRAATTSRWTIAGDGLGAEVLAATCGFVVGPHNVDALEGFALWCVREQVAVATAAIAGGIVSLVGARSGGKDPGELPDAGAGSEDGTGAVPYGWGPYPDMELRQDEHEVVRHYERYVDPGRDASSVPLAEALLEAFGTLDDQMREEGTGVWGRWTDVPVFTCETPLSWERYPDDFVGQLDEKAPPTALVDASLDDHPRAGNGLRISARVPWRPGPQAFRALAEMNLLYTEVPGATHTIGAWSLEQRPAGEEDAGGSQDGALPAYVYSVYLPAALAGPALAGQDLGLPAIMREILLTVAREVLLSRRMLAPELRAWEDDHPYVGLAARTGDASAHGLAWGETGEGRNAGALLLDHIYAECVGDGSDWADTRPDGFTWWPYEQAQDVTSIPNDPASPRHGSVIRMATEVRNRVPVTPEAMAVIAGLNAELGRSVLVLGADGRLFLGCHLAVSDEGPWMRRWAHALAVDQYATARDLLSRLDALGALGEPAISAHPFSGPRPDPGELLGIREALHAPLAEQARSSLTPLVALLATAGLGFLPHQAAVRDDGGVDFAWHPSQSDIALPADPAIRVSSRPGDTGSGPGWVVRSYVPVTGDIAARARWCNDQNAALLDGPGTTGLHVTGGWGLTPGGECCLTTWLSPFMVTGEDNQVLCLVDLLRDHQAAVVTALLSTGPDAVASQPLTPARLAAGLEEVLGSFRKVIEHPAGYQWAVETWDTGVVVTLSGTLEDGGADGDVRDAELAEAGETAFRTVVQVPVTGNQAELALVYAAFLGQSLTRVQTPASYDLIPGELARWSFTTGQVNHMIWQLTREGLINWPHGEPAGLFDAGPGQGKLTIGFMSPDRLYAAAPLRVEGIVDGAALPWLPRGQARDIDVLGTWRERDDGIAYEVTIPPAGLVWGTDRTAAETLTWVCRHVIRHVQASLLGQADISSPPRPADSRWRDLGNGSAAIVCGTELVASFHAQLLELDKFEKKTPPDRSEETQRSVEESATSLAAGKEPAQRLLAWVARQWEAQLDAWWLLGEPVFWCEHIAPDDDEQPLMDWFMCFPAAMACDQCGDRIRAALFTGRRAAVCDSCGQESTGMVFARTPGMSMIANYEFCRSCSAAFTGGEQPHSPDDGEKQPA